MEEQKTVSIRLVPFILIVLLIIAIIVGIVFAVNYFKEDNTQAQNNEVYNTYLARGAQSI